MLSQVQEGERDLQDSRTIVDKLERKSQVLEKDHANADELFKKADKEAAEQEAYARALRSEVGECVVKVLLAWYTRIFILAKQSYSYWGTELLSFVN